MLWKLGLWFLLRQLSQYTYGRMDNQIRHLRKKRKVTQEQLADALNVTRQTINAIELGKYSPSLELAFEIADYFKRKVDEVFHYRG